MASVFDKLLSGAAKDAIAEGRALLFQPGAPSAAVLTIGTTVIIGALLLAMVTCTSGIGAGNRVTLPQILFSLYARFGRLRNLLCSPCDRCRRRYPLANTVQIPFFSSLSDLYTFVFGYKTRGLFLEVGAFDGESFSNTSGLADLGWTGHYVEPIPQYADACRKRHAGNSAVKVHTVCAGGKDGEAVELSAAGPFSSAVEDEIETVASSSLHKALQAFGWGHSKVAKVKTTTKTLNTFCKEQAIPDGGQIDVMVLDVEGFEWPILQAFDLKRFRPKLVIVEIQELQARYRGNERVQADARAMFKTFADAGYAILYKDVVNTVFIHSAVQCVGGA